MKGYTNLEQSKELAEILPLESADMCYLQENGKAKTISPLKLSEILNVSKPQVIPCWSLAALLDVLNKTAHFMDEDASVNLSSYKTIGWTLVIYKSNLGLVVESNPIDACYEMVIKLHEQNLL